MLSFFAIKTIPRLYKVVKRLELWTLPFIIRTFEVNNPLLGFLSLSSEMNSKA